MTMLDLFAVGLILNFDDQVSIYVTFCLLFKHLLFRFVFMVLILLLDLL